jgi:uncharacterized metal-binding protein
MPQKMDLAVYRGDDHSWTFTLFSDTGATVEFDLTGVTVKAEIRARSADPVLAILGCTITLPNQIDVVLTSAQSGMLTGKLAWDLQLAMPDSTIKTVVAGAVTVTNDITESTRTLSRTQALVSA